MNIHEKYINRCIQIGKNAAPSAYPNPNVGCCIVYKDCIIGEGFTSAYGGSHAEVNAINSVKNKELWMQLYELVKSYEIKWIWVKAHAGNTLNEEVDLLAKQAAELN